MNFFFTALLTWIFKILANKDLTNEGWNGIKDHQDDVKQ